ncbi:GNAT family N-acetyltransferase [Paenibacillus cellulositrophicus]|uniref:GNAT family N-acetyltransferase n=1 Tax=Paenibacillus cellulositrophicus TaxID=562959 RepID=UPI001FCCB5A7|nr:GNAT family protein [Paenibacillus cellulositrophicus]
MRLNRVFARHFGGNPASGKVMVKVGMKYEGTLRQHAKKKGKYEDLVYYGLLKEEYLS